MSEMIISIASGKGGTGKTTVATNLALSLEQPVTLLDCDVDEPNAHLFIRPGNTERSVVETFVPAVDKERCSSCRACVEICRFNALTMVGAKVLLFEELCHGCRGCEVVCPEQAVGAGSRELGLLHQGRRGDLKLAWGELRVGEAMAPPLIRAVRRQADPGGLTIIDAPPGTSCPMIAAVQSTDFVLFVSEPTPFGLHDLVLAAEAVRELGIASGLVINRADIGDDRLHRYAAEQAIPILLEIPFDRRIAEAYSSGTMMIDVLPSWRLRFQQLYDDIARLAHAVEVNP